MLNKDMNRFVFIAVNFNSSHHTLNYLDSIDILHKEDEDTIEIIIVDNHSHTEDLKRIEEYAKKISNLKIIRLLDNIGYFKGLNQGIGTFDKDGNTMTVVGNNDLTFDQDFIINLKKIKYDNSVLVIAPNIITKDGRQQNPLVIDKISLISKLKTRIYLSNYYIGQIFRFINQKFIKKSVVLKNNYGQMKIKSGIGACYVLTPNFFKYFDRLDDRVFMWGEEALLSNQVESVGGTTLYDPTLIIQHHESASAKHIQMKQKYYIVKESYRIYKRYL
ncbi:MAG: glycosyltransferase [Syntrophaceae bacterium]